MNTHTHIYICICICTLHDMYIYIIMYTWKSWSMGFSYRAQPAQPGLQSSTRKCNCDHQRTPDCGHGSLTTLSWSCWLMIAFISCYIIFDDLWWSLMIFDDLWWSLMQSWKLHPRNLCDRAHIAICLRQEHCKSHTLKLECWSRDSWFWGSITLEASYCDWTCSNGLCAFDNSWVGKL